MSLLEKRLLGKLNKKKKEKKEKTNEAPKNTVRKLTQVQLNKRNIEIFLEENELPLFKLESICFSIFDKETFAKKSVCDIENPNRNLDLYYSLEDPRLGTIENWKLCGHCDKTTEECTGHFSRINVGFNFIHPLYRSIVVMVLQCICHSCNKLLLKEPQIKEKDLYSRGGFNRLKEFAKASEGEKCMNPKCGVAIKFKAAEANNTSTRFVSYFTKKGNEESPKKQMTVDTVLARLKAISDKDLVTLGFKYDNQKQKLIVHPKDFIMNYIPVVPITDRPPGITETEKKDHSLTYAYNDILAKYLESKHHISLDDQEDCFNKIINIYLSLIVNKKNDPNTYTRNQREPLEAIKDMINCKEGIIRNNLLGKRCDYTGRSVLGPNNSLNFGWIALPKDMEVITIPEIITHYNFKKINQLAREGNIEFLCPKKGNLAGRKLKFDYKKHKGKLSIGDKIERLTEHGDTITFNRAPTLQPQSMLGYKVTLQNKKTIGVHMSSTQGLNADFDSDEGNTHQVQTPEAQVEARLIMNVENNIISYSNSAPEAALFYNSIVSAFLLSADNVVLEEKEFLKGLEYVNSRLNSDYVKNNYKTLNSRLDGIEPFSGKALISVILPPDFWYQKFDDEGNEVFIGKGILRKGRLKKDHLGSTNFSIISAIHKEYGNKTTVDFISASNFLFNWYIFRIGFTVTFKDFSLGEKTDEFEKKREEIIQSTNKILEKIDKRSTFTITDIEEKNQEILKNFNNAKNRIYNEVGQILDYNNSIFVMVDSGAKGSKAKAIEIVGSKGIILVIGKLAERNLAGNTRWLSTFSPEDYRLESRGFSVNSYYEGLDVDAYFAECQAGREGLIDTAVTTAKIGYMQRKMVKAQEDLIINYDGSIRNQRDVVFQFSYGPNFKTNEMVIDKSDDNFPVFSFINIKNMVGKINYSKGFKVDIHEEIKNLAKEINQKYNFSDNFSDDIDDIGNDKDDKIYIAEEDFDEE